MAKRTVNTRTIKNGDVTVKIEVTDANNQTARKRSTSSRRRSSSSRRKTSNRRHSSGGDMFYDD